MSLRYFSKSMLQANNIELRDNLNKMNRYEVDDIYKYVCNIWYDSFERASFGEKLWQKLEPMKWN